MNAISTKITLDKEDVPKEYVNILPYLRSPLPPPLDPKTEEPVGPEALMAIFAEECVRQEMSEKKRIPIPEPVREALIHYSRPTPLQRARRLEKALNTPAKIYFKREDVSPSGSHKLNTALAQAYYAKKEGVERLATETGAGQWGSAVSLACEYFGLEAMVYMVRVSYDQKEHRGTLMRAYGGAVVPSPSEKTKFGKQLLTDSPDHPGTLGIAISEALEDTLSDESTKYTLGSVLNHVLLHQTVIGQEAIAQLESVDETPDALVGCVGGGSNFAGMIYPFIADGRFDDADLIAVEPVACPTLTKGEYRYDFGDTAGITPKLKMYTLGKDFTPPGIHAGGLRYHGCAPTLSALRHEDRIKPVAYDQIPVLEAGIFFAQQEGIIPAPESAHAVKASIDLAREAKAKDEEKTIVFNLSGHGQFDMGAYRALMNGELEE
ncbi:MAG: TrpB-like pyridoxal phosphate-dependent enzyme [Candidatus Lokiarchaeota archaeon]|nr:TrpB-like pyridoxal phosphate-dependent enzyme [Candidatus Lokiarchaeota archaeon]